MRTSNKYGCCVSFVIALFLMTQSMASLAGQDSMRTAKKRPYETKALTKAQFQELVASPEWILHEGASKEWGAPFYVGPNGVVAFEPQVDFERPKLMLKGGPDFLASLLHPVKVVSVMANFQMNTESFMNRVPQGVRIDLLPDPEEDRHLTRDVAPGGEGFLDALVAIGELMRKSLPDVYWRVYASKGIITSIELVTKKGPFALDARVYKQYWGEGKRQRLSESDINSAARLYLKFH